MPTPAPLQHNVVTTTSSGGTPNTVSAAFGSNNSAGSLLIAGVGINLAAASISGIIDSQGNAWSKAVATTMSTTLDGEVWYAPNSKAGANTLTITITGTTTARVTTVDLVEVSNIVLSSPLDKTSSNQGTGNAIASLAGPTTRAGEFLFGFVARGAIVGPSAGPTDSSSSPAVTWNALDEVHSQNPSVISAYGIQSSVGSFAVKWTTTSANFTAFCASFLNTQTISQTLSSSGAGSASIARSIGKTMSASGAASAAMTRGIGKVLTASGAGSAAMARSIGKTLAASVAGAGALAKGIGKVLVASSAAAALMTRQISKTLIASAAAVASFVKTIGKFLSAVAQAVANLVGTKITPVVVAPIIIDAPLLAVVPIAAPIVGKVVFENAPLVATAIIVARIK
jgi:hypothetical protein